MPFGSGPKQSDRVIGGQLAVPGPQTQGTDRADDREEIRADRGIKRGRDMRDGERKKGEMKTKGEETQKRQMKVD